MIILNISFFVEKGVETDWLAWMKNTHLPDMNSDLFDERRLFKLRNIQSEDPAYSLQFHFSAIRSLENFETSTKDKLLAGIGERYGEKVLSFSSYLEEV